MPEYAAATVEPLEETVQKKHQRDAAEPKRQPRYNVILWNDDDHSYDYVIAMLMELFGYTMEKGFLMAKEVDTRGRVKVLTTTKEHAELKSGLERLDSSRLPKNLVPSRDHMSAEAFNAVSAGK